MSIHIFSIDHGTQRYSGFQLDEVQWQPVNSDTLAQAVYSAYLKSAVARCLRLEPRLAKTDYLQNIKLMARQLLGPEARLCFDHAILKPPHNNCPTLWHQEAAYEKPGGSERRLSFWLPLQNVSVESGCLQFIRGSNSGDLLPHHPIAIGSHALTAHVEPLEAVPCPIKAGDFTLHSGRTLHYAGPNVTDQPRLAWVLQQISSKQSTRLVPGYRSSQVATVLHQAEIRCSICRGR